MYRIVFSPRSDHDVDSIYRYIARLGFPDNAAAFTDEILEFCYTLRTFPNCGTLRANVAEGLRTVGFHTQVEIVFRVSEVHAIVTIVRILYGKQSLEKAFKHVH